MLRAFRYRQLAPLLSLLAGIFALPGCGETQARAKNVSYSETARDNYQKAMAELEDENFLEGH